MLRAFVSAKLNGLFISQLEKFSWNVYETEATYKSLSCLACLIPERIHMSTLKTSGPLFTPIYTHYSSPLVTSVGIPPGVLPGYPQI